MKSESNSKGMGITGFIESGQADHMGSATPEQRGSLEDWHETGRGGGKRSWGFCLFRTRSWGSMLQGQAVILRVIVETCRRNKGGGGEWSAGCCHSPVQFR